MITEDYVSFETAELLNKKEFDGEFHIHYFFNGKDNKVEMLPKPTLQMAMKWLREVHNLHIFTVPRWEDVEYMPGEWEKQMIGYQYVILNIGGTNRKINQPITTALSPESSYEAAIKYCLENVI